MSLRAGMCGFALVAALSAPAAEPSAPLEDSKKELKALQKGAPAPGSEGTVDKFRDAMPQMRLPAAETRPFDPLGAEKAEKELKKKKAAEKNWLVDGMERLDKNNKPANHETAEMPVAAKTEDTQPATGDPAYLLKVYSEQQKNTEAKADQRQAGAARPDPLKPFLQGWLADSPARGKFFDEYTRKTEASPAYSGPVAGGPMDSGSGPVLNGLDLRGSGPKGDRVAPTAAPVNPYLQGLDMSVLQDSGPRRSLPPVVPAFQPAPAPATGSLAGPAPTSRPADKKPPPSALADDRKYFPQLKKF